MDLKCLESRASFLSLQRYAEPKLCGRKLFCSFSFSIALLFIFVGRIPCWGVTPHYQDFTVNGSTSLAPSTTHPFFKNHPVALVGITEGMLLINSVCAGYAPRTTGAVILVTTPLAAADSNWKEYPRGSWIGAIGFGGLGIYNVTGPQKEFHFKWETFGINLLAWHLIGGAMWLADPKSFSNDQLSPHSPPYPESPESEHPISFDFQTDGKSALVIARLVL